ncbi:MAG: hypothetical protein E6Q67_00910 [Roseateles sp.]|nr:MAG: hypothetical protein E6Q67_00910 [Roseateles sp.]
MSYGSNEAVEDAEDDCQEENAQLLARGAAELVAARVCGRDEAIEKVVEWWRNEAAAAGDPTGVTEIENSFPFATKAAPSHQVAAIAEELIEDVRDAIGSY